MSNALPDLKAAAYIAQGYGNNSRHVADMELEFLQGHGATAKSLPDAWVQVLEVRVRDIKGRNRVDLFRQYLIEQEFGHQGQMQINDMEAEWYRSGAPMIAPLR